MFESEIKLPFFLNSFSRKFSQGYFSKNGTLIFEVPGFSKDDIKIDLDGHIMHVYGEKEVYGEKFELDKKFALNHGILDPENPITARVENGLLYISLKKSTKPKQTSVKIS